MYQVLGLKSLMSPRCSFSIQMPGGNEGGDITIPDSMDGSRSYYAEGDESDKDKQTNTIRAHS